MLDTPVVGRRNLIINGAMKVAQRGDVTGHANGYGGSDRFQFASSGATRVAMSRSTVTPTGQGFSNSQRVNCTTADTSLAAGDYAMIRQKIEGSNLQHLLYGTSSAKKLTLQFWVRSGKTGTHIVELYHGDVAYTNGQTYTIATADTWQKVTVTFDGYQTTALDNDSGIGIQVAWWLAAGSTYSGGTFSSNTWTNTTANRAVGQVNCMDSTSNNFQLTGVQIEVGDTATDFEHRTRTEELQLCYRYFRNIGRIMQGYREGYSTASITLYPGMRLTGSDATNIVATINGGSGVMYSRGAVNNSTGTLTGTVGHSSTSSEQALQCSLSHNGTSTGSAYNGTVGGLYMDGFTLDAEL